MEEKKDNTLFIDSRLPESGLVPRGENTRAWGIYVNGDSLREIYDDEPITSLVVVARNNAGKQLGRLEYGAEPTPEGEPSDFDTWLFKDISGAVIVPFVVINGELLVGVVEQFRFAEQHNMYNSSGKVWNAPRGNFSELREADAAAQHELIGEVGLFKESPFRLEGENVNVNNAWFAYEDELKNGKSVKQGGVALYAVPVNQNEMEPAGPSGNWRVSDRILEGRPKGSPYEKIGKCLFVPWQEAIKLRDGFTVIVVARLLAHLQTCSEAQIMFHDAPY